MSERDQVGFSQRIRLEWLERTANLVLAGNSRDEIRTALRAILEDKLSVGSHSERGNRQKAITILLRIWVSVPEHLSPLRDAGLRLVDELPLSQHLPLHWGMSAASYPFFSKVAEATGRLLRLQGTASAAQVQRRMRELYGERETVARAARRVLRCFIDWGVLQESAEKGVYTATASCSIPEQRTAAWLVEAIMTASSQQIASLKGVVQSPMLFPFTFTTYDVTAAHQHGRLEFFRHGVNDEMVSIAR